jgi:hypothetical protein
MNYIDPFFFTGAFGIVMGRGSVTVALEEDPDPQSQAPPQLQEPPQLHPPPCPHPLF